MIFERVGDQILVKQQNANDVFINISDATVTEWDDESLGYVSSFTNYAYRDHYSNLQDGNGDPLGNTLQEVKDALGALLGSSSGVEFPEPFITSIEGEKTGLNSTADLIIKGGYFTKSTTVEIQGQTVNSVQVIDDDEMLVNVTTGGTKGDYDVTVDNGKSTVKAGGFSVYNIIIIEPKTADWVRTQGVTVADGQLLPTGTNSTWNRGGSFQGTPVNKDFELSFNIEYMAGFTTGGYAMIGVDNSDPNRNYNTIDYAIYFSNGSNLNIYENGQYRAGVGSFVNSDTFKVKREDGVVSYLKNGDVIYTSQVQSTSGMVFDCSLYRYLGAKNITLKYID